MENSDDISSNDEVPRDPGHAADLSGHDRPGHSGHIVVCCQQYFLQFAQNIQELCQQLLVDGQ